MSKALVCTCEDVTVTDVEHAIERGYHDVESVKRYTGFGTGICQGKSCHSAVAALLKQKAPALKSEGVVPFTPRPPLYPTELRVLASAPVDESVPPVGGVPQELEHFPSALRPEGPVPQKAKVVIIGGGIMGLSLAYNLALRGETDVVVLERGYLCAGASGRNGGGVRMQWGTPALIELAKRSIDLMKGFARDLGVNVWLRQGGYLFLAKRKDTAYRLDRNAALHNKYGVPTRIITADEARNIVPDLTMKDCVTAAYNPEDGVIFPWAFLWGYAQGCVKRGVKVETYTNVTGFETSNGQVRKVKTDRGDIACDTVVLASGAWSPQVAKLADVTLPNEPHRHEILSTEPLKPFLSPLVSVLDTGLYFSQSMRGEIVGGMGDPKEPAGPNMGSTLRFVARFAQALTEQLPHVGQVKVLRQWGGLYDVTPDNNPILGRTPGLDNLLQLSGFVGHGFMMAPAVAERMAQWMTSSNSDELFTRFNLRRFEEGTLEREDMIIG
ncbi:FAD-dependent oxidoreductase [Corallococcus sp. AB004]|uniref:FAD-dependent oxidoreductase n=1 Tax=Corallococcus exiguus TaxID=83462 RepID=UPI000EA0C7A0|nr:FAD-dependent oxidoreductase [Corallococcus exiguus]NPD29015.1 FAD-dependent oxidoreductase [Corallococcus exiguus]RKI34119.1 FAD-dependent oxidoreductase [Corallococcus sp. AB004]